MKSAHRWNGVERKSLMTKNDWHNGNSLMAKVDYINRQMNERNKKKKGKKNMTRKMCWVFVCSMKITCIKLHVRVIYNKVNTFWCVRHSSFSLYLISFVHLMLCFPNRYTFWRCDCYRFVCSQFWRAVAVAAVIFRLRFYLTHSRLGGVKILIKCYECLFLNIQRSISIQPQERKKKMLRKYSRV